MICATLSVLGAGQAIGLTVKPAGVPLGTVPEIEVSAMRDEPVLLTLNLGNFMSGEPPTILSWQLALSVVPSEGAAGSMTVEKADPIMPSLFEDRGFLQADELGTSKPLILELDTGGIGAQIDENAEQGITEIELSHSPDAAGTFILALSPFELDEMNRNSEWLEKTGTGFESRPFANTPAASGLIELARFTVTGASLAGDFNGDLVVDAADYTVWRDNFGTPGFTVEHYAIWKEHFGESASGPPSNAVPEPNSWLLTVLCGLNVVVLPSLGLRSRVAG